MGHLFRRLWTKNKISRPSAYSVVKLWVIHRVLSKKHWCSNSNILTRKIEPLSESLWLFLQLMAAVMSIKSECVCVLNSMWLFSVLFTELHLQQLPPWTILTSSGHMQQQTCPLDSQILWQRLVLTFDLNDCLGRRWEHGELLILGSGAL